MGNKSELKKAFRVKFCQLQIPSNFLFFCFASCTLGDIGRLFKYQAVLHNLLIMFSFTLFCHALPGNYEKLKSTI